VINLQVDSEELKSVCHKYGVSTLSIFGSTVRGDRRPDSDVDILVTFSKRIGLVGLVALERELSTILGQKVDLVTEAAISPYLRERILKDRQIVYAA
jgi:predicted nucleotidyltransferase